jgi:TRAP transporter TAXI family solute receptor
MKRILWKNILTAVCVVALLFTTAGSSFAKSDWGRGGSLSTASVGGTFYVWGGAWAKLISNQLPEYQIGVEVTGGPVHNVKLVNVNQAEFGLCSMPAAYDGFNGLRWAKGEEYQDIRVLFPMYPSYATMWALKKHGIETVHDLNGRIINLAPKGGTPDTYYRIMFDILGVKPKNIVNSGFSDLVGQMKDGMIEAGAGSGGSPFGPAIETEATHEINLISFSDEDMDKILAELPSWFKGKIKKEGFESLTEDHPTLQYWNILITNKDLPEDLAYSLTKIFFENLDYFQDVYKPTMATKPEDVLRSVIPIHPGAARYYKEIGIDIPADKIK